MTAARSFRRRRLWARRVHVTVDNAIPGEMLGLNPSDEAWAKVHAEAWGEARWVRVDRLAAAS
jgi:hypothetical protein